MKNRRAFIKLCSAAGIAGSLHLPTSILSQSRKENPIGIKKKLASWCHLIDYGKPDFIGTDDENKRQMDNVVKAGIDILFPFIHYHYKAYYNSGLIKAEDRFTRVTELARERGIEIHPIVIAIHDLGLSEDEVIKRSYQGGPDAPNPKSQKLCASWDINREGGLRILKDILKNHRVDGIHLDYIRYGDTSQSINFPCQCAACQEQYLRVFKKSLITAADLQSPGMLYKYLNLRGENIRGIFEQVRGVIKGAGLPVSMAARANYYNSALVEGQDWVQWSKEGKLDFICPMNYTNDREAHKRNFNTQISLLENSVPVMDGIARKWGRGENTTAQMIQQAEDALESGASGVSVFSLSALNEKDINELGSFKRANM